MVQRRGAGHAHGGYLPFTVDITEVLAKENTILVCVRDATNKSQLPRGKQTLHPHGIWYTPQSGIWQTVWLESVPQNYIRSLHVTPLFDAHQVEITVEGEGQCMIDLEGKRFTFPAGVPAHVPVQSFRPWSPEHPTLYPFSVTLGDDTVYSYFAMRKCSVETDKDGVRRLFLNGKPYFHNGLLDQGYWPDGLYTAPSDDALVYDIQLAKDMGFNMLRKHIKVECDRWYYHCDRLGMLVWQDMPWRRQALRPAHRLDPARDGLASRRQLVSPLRPHERDGAQGVFERAARHGHHALQPPMHRRVGAVQRGLGSV